MVESGRKKIPPMAETDPTIPGPSGSRWHDSGDEPRRPADESHEDGATAAGPVHTEEEHHDSLRPDPSAPPEARTTIPEELQGEEGTR